MKIVIASDSFKGSLSSLEVAQAASLGICQVFPDADILAFQVADGGEGTLEAVVSSLSAQFITTTVADPLMRPIAVQYGLASDTAIIEMAAASGLTLLQPRERNPWLTSTYGTGQMIMDAIQRGCRKFIVGIGGSATNDAGIGMLQALGFRFYDKDNQLLPHGCGAIMAQVAHIDLTAVPQSVWQSSFIVACDVDTPFCGPNGAAHVFAPQKGADEQMVYELDRGMLSLAQVLERTFDRTITHIPGTGAAGGLGGAFYACLNAQLQPGIDVVLDAIHFDSIIHDADLIITGEGKMDAQTAKGKVAAGVLARAKIQHIPVIAIAGCVDMCDTLAQMGFAGIYSILKESMPLQVAMQRDVAMSNIEKTMARALQSFPS